MFLILNVSFLLLLCLCISILGLSNDIGKQMKLNPEMNLTPIQIQLIYDLQKDGQSTVSENNKLLNVSPESAAASSAIPLVIDQMKDVSITSEESESR